MLRTIADSIAEYMDQSPVRIVLPYPVARFFAPVVSTLDRIQGKRQLFTPIAMNELNSNRYLSHEKASQKLGYEPRPFKETIFDTLDWFRDNGYLEKNVGVKDHG